MLISAFAAMVMFATPEAAQGSASTSVPAPSAEAKPAMRKVCTSVPVSGSNLPKRKCKTVPVKDESKAAEDTATADAAKTQ
jgi:hypothetical protein